MALQKTNILPTFTFEQELWQQGYATVAGIDEVGMGAFAGPLVVAGVIFPKNYSDVHGFSDSKLLTPKKRGEQAEIIYAEAMQHHIAVIPVAYINQHGLAKAVEQGIQAVCKNLNPDFCLLDGIRLLDKTKQKAIIKGDQKVASIAAASIIAKVYRDALMQDLHKEYPLYKFSKNKGYGTQEHRDAIKRFGLSDMHRTSFYLEPYLH